MQGSSILFTILTFVSFSTYSSSQSQATLAEQLGYAKDAKLLIIHGDDIGVSHSVNRASFDALAKGMVNSGSIMVPCPWLPEVGEYAKEHPEADLGIHLTLTAEWKLYKWPPVSPVAEVPGLVNTQGFMYDNCADVFKNSNATEVEKELRAQIDRAIAFGINPTHLDSHMGCLFNPDYLGIYIKLGLEYGIPVMLPKESMSRFPEAAKMLPPGILMVDRIHGANPGNYENGMADFYASTLENLQPGVNVMIIHLAYDDAEMQAVTVDHPDYGAAWRQADFDFFTNERCEKILKEKGIQLVTWRQIGQLIKK